MESANIHDERDLRAALKQVNRQVQRNKCLTASQLEKVSCALWEEIEYVKGIRGSPADKYFETRNRVSDGRAARDQANGIARESRKLMRRVSRIKEELVEPPLLPYARLFGLQLTEWSRALADVRKALQNLIAQAEWRETKEYIAGSVDQRRLRDHVRDELAAMVALVLVQQGVNTTKAKTGMFARILFVVHGATGFPQRSLSGVERDVHRALSNPVVLSYLAQYRGCKTATQSKRQD